MVVQKYWNDLDLAVSCGARIGLAKQAAEALTKRPKVSISGKFWSRMRCGEACRGDQGQQTAVAAVRVLRACETQEVGPVGRGGNQAWSIRRWWMA